MGGGRSSSSTSGRGAWWDDPLTDEASDGLERGAFAAHTSRLIDSNHSTTTSVVYGLEGPWGSGKSTVINFIENDLESSEHDWKVVQFTPWATSGTEALFSEFFNVLVQVAPDARSDKALREKISRYASIARPFAAAIPYVGAAAAEASRSAEEVFRRPWDVAFREVSAELSSIGTAILVVVDDIDRLQIQELLDLLKVVRLLGRFPGVDFLLAYDERTIVDTLQDPQRGTVTRARARAFMEKIVQYPLMLPPLLRQKVIEMLDEGLTEIITQPRIDARLDVRRLQTVLTELAPRLLITPRAVARFLAQVRAQFAIHDPDEIDDTDLVLSTLLRVRFPDIYEMLQHHKTPLTRGTPNGVLRANTRSEPTDWEPLLNLTSDVERADARSILEAIFPAVREENPPLARPPRFGHPQYFDRYLAQAIPAGDIPDTQIAEALLRASVGNDEMLRDFVLSEDRGKSSLALGRMGSRYPAVSEPWRQKELRGPVTVPLLAAGMRLLVELPPGRETLVSPAQQLAYWMSNLLTWLLHNNPDAAVRPALDHCSNVTSRAHVVSMAQNDPDGRLPEPTKRALDALFHREATTILDLLLADLRDRDDATGSEGNPFLYQLVVDAGMLEELRSRVRSGLDGDMFAIVDVAARFVSFYWTIGIGTAPSGAKFNGKLFTQITGVAARSSEHIERDQGIDTSWVGRRRIAADHLLSGSGPD